MTPEHSTHSKKKEHADKVEADKEFARSQQMPVYQPSMEDMENTWRIQADRCRQDRLAALAREFPEVADLIKENKILRGEEDPEDEHKGSRKKSAKTTK